MAFREAEFTHKELAFKSARLSIVISGKIGRWLELQEGARYFDKQPSPPRSKST
jgi:hypothetical protein